MDIVKSRGFEDVVWIELTYDTSGGAAAGSGGCSNELLVP